MDSIGSELFTFVLEKLSDLLAKEIKILSTNSKNLLNDLKQELERAQACLIDIDEVQRRAKLSHEYENKVKDVFKKVPEIEDFLDEFYQKEEEEKTKRGDEFRCFPCTFNPVRKHGAIKGATRLKQELRDALQRLQESTTSLPRETPRKRLPTRSNIVKEEFILGLEKDVEAYLAKLVECSTDVAIVGMGGAGKTTLARKIYNHQRIAVGFLARAWVCVSQEWDKVKLLRTICAQFGFRLQEDETTFPERELNEFLGSNSCFFVLDDVWKSEALKELLPILRSGSGSRVLVTTRNKDIFSFPQHDFSIDQIRSLTLKESWDLFLLTLKRNHWDDGNPVEGDFEVLGKEMVGKCKGLPLAIVALAGLLSTKITTRDWERIKGDVGIKIMCQDGADDAYGVVKEILELSYIDLPYHLKPCFLYLGIFQEDCDIDVASLIQLWISEGFVNPNRHDPPEEVATEFLDVLVQRSMVEVVSRDYDGKVLTIRVHDLMRELCFEKAKEFNFFEISSPLASASTNSLPYRTIMHRKSNERLRSYIWQEDRIMKPIELKLVFKEMKFVRVLSLIRVDLTKAKMHLGELIFLRYLQLKFCRVTQESLESIKKLRNLHTFKYQGSRNGKLSVHNMVGEMNHLRHLYLTTGVDGGRVLGVNNKHDLQILKVVAGEWLTQELQHVSEGLQELQLIDLQSESQLEAIYDFVSNRCVSLGKISLSMKYDSTVEFELDKLKSRHCTALELNGKVGNNAIKFPRRLVRLSLIGSKIEEGEQLREALSGLGELRCLVMGVESYRAGGLRMSGLPRLERLEMSGLPALKEWSIEEGALSRLRELEISTFGRLERLPDGIQRIATLRQLRVDGMPPAFAKRLRHGEKGGSQGEDFHLIRHIPIVKIEGADDYE